MPPRKSNAATSSNETKKTKAKKQPIEVLKKEDVMETDSDNEEEINETTFDIKSIDKNSNTISSDNDKDGSDNDKDGSDKESNKDGSDNDNEKSDKDGSEKESNKKSKHIGKSSDEKEDGDNEEEDEEKVLVKEPPKKKGATKAPKSDADKPKPKPRQKKAPPPPMTIEDYSCEFNDDKTKEHIFTKLITKLDKKHDIDMSEKKLLIICTEFLNTIVEGAYEEKIYKIHNFGTFSSKQLKPTPTKPNPNRKALGVKVDPNVNRMFEQVKQ